MNRFKILLLVLLNAFIYQNVLNAQIVYTDVDPDITVNEFLQGYGIDFNQDNKIDVHLTLLDNVGVWVMLLIPDSELDDVSVVYDGEEASVLEFGDDISAASNYWELGSGWGGLLYGHWDGDGTYGNWIDTQEHKYLGIKFSDNSNDYYAWIYLSTIIHDYNDYEFTIHGFAYNSTAEEGIEAGDMGNGVGMDEMENKSVSFYPNPAQNTLYFKEIKQFKEVMITDISGKRVLIDQNVSRQSIDISSLKAGVYFLKIDTEDEQFVTKFIKE